MVLEANIDVLEALRKYYQSLLSNKDFTMRRDCAAAVRTFASQINDAMYDLKMQNSRAKLLVRITSDRKSLVRLTPVPFSNPVEWATIYHSKT
jgi:hypothetical protein